MALNVKRMQDLNLDGQRVLIREDLNVPVKDGVVTSDARIRAALPTINAATEAGARVVIGARRFAARGSGAEQSGLGFLWRLIAISRRVFIKEFSIDISDT